MEKTQLKKRNYGIDIARILAMLMVVFLHNLLQGGVLKLDNVHLLDLSYWYIENLAIVAVNLFAMISGYLLVDKLWKPSKIFSLWRQVVFWSVMTTIISMVILQSYDFRNLVKAAFPLVFKQYWYFNAYVVLFMVIPFLNAGFSFLSERTVRFVILALLGLSVTVGYIGNLFELNGYSGFWLILMYMAGAWIKLYGNEKIHLKIRWLLFLYFSGAVVSLIGEYISLNYIGHTLSWIAYNSPIVVIQTVALFQGLQKVKIFNTRLQNILKLISLLTFAVYLIGGNPLFFNNILKNSFRFIQRISFIKGMSIIMVASIGMFLAFVILDYIRKRLIYLARCALRF
ncbi:acyltransferase [Levilactobacillus namurensis]|uniref:acyltransferase n=1 Tax=Levilactobacillus namurensis TaxID=380393 RepID=UPI0026E988D3|nr:acyltransferase family protein [Levilactobacillus namurensis]